MTSLLESEAKPIHLKLLLPFPLFVFSFGYLVLSSLLPSDLVSHYFCPSGLWNAFPGIHVAVSLKVPSNVPRVPSNSAAVLPSDLLQPVYTVVSDW